MKRKRRSWFPATLSPNLGTEIVRVGDAGKPAAGGGEGQGGGDGGGRAATSLLGPRCEAAQRGARLHVTQLSSRKNSARSSRCFHYTDAERGAEGDWTRPR